MLRTTTSYLNASNDIIHSQLNLKDDDDNDDDFIIKYQISNTSIQNINIIIYDQPKTSVNY